MEPVDPRITTSRGGPEKVTAQLCHARAGAAPAMIAGQASVCASAAKIGTAGAHDATLRRTG